MNSLPTPLAPHELQAALRELPGWVVETDKLVCTRTLESFPAAIAYVAGVAEIAEQLNHHPDIDVRWRTVTLRVNTHDAGSVVTDRDTLLAAAVLELAL